MKLNKIFFSLIFFIVVILLNATELDYSILNEFEMIQRDLGNSYEDYYAEKMKLQLFYKAVTLGIKYDYYRPKYDKFIGVDQAGSEENENYFDEYYLQYSGDHLFAQVGTFDAVIGSGLALHNFYDEDFDEDKRLMGLYVQSFFERWQTQIFYGEMDIAFENAEDDKDNIGAIDSEINVLENLTFAGSYILHEQAIEDCSEKNRRNIYSSRFNFFHDLFDLNGEFAYSEDEENLIGRALYTNASYYLGNFTFSTAYKNYTNFDFNISDLPMANHSNKELAHGWDVGKDEEGLMGEIRFLPNFENEFIINYAEGWNDNFKVRQSNLYLEYRHEFDELSFKSELEMFEEINEISTNWEKEITPKFTCDFLLGEFPILLKLETQYIEEKNATRSATHYEPKFQSDISYKKYSISFTIEKQIDDAIVSEEGEDGEYWIGAELAANLFGNTDLRLFGGKEKGGLVCRNGICKTQAEFEGLRVQINTEF